MNDFFDMVSLSAATQEAVDALEQGQEDAALNFAKHVPSIDAPHTENAPFNLYTEENAVIRFAQWILSSSQESGIDHAVEILSRHCEEFDYADTPLLTPDSAASVFQAVNALFPYAETVIGKHPIDLLIIDAQHEYRNGESTAVFSDDGMHGCVCIYQLQNDCTSAPEHILLHELGHLLHMKVAGNPTEVPASFKEYLCRIGTDYRRLSGEQLREVFADTFKLAVLSHHPEWGIPVPGIPKTTLDICYQYIATIFAHLT